MNDLKTILLTTDFSDTSKKAFPAALSMAEKFGAKIVLCYIEDDRFPPLVVEYMAVGLDEIRQRQHEQSRKRLEAFAGESLGSDVSYDTVVALGIPHAEIIRVAEEYGADLLVMSTHGRGFISHAVMGSTTERVLRRSPCPVLVVRDSRKV